MLRRHVLAIVDSNHLACTSCGLNIWLTLTILHVLHVSIFTRPDLVLRLDQLILRDNNDNIGKGTITTQHKQNAKPRSAELVDVRVIVV